MDSTLSTTEDLRALGSRPVTPEPSLRTYRGTMLNTLGYAGGMTRWVYRAHPLRAADVLTPNFFDRGGDVLRRGDLIDVIGSDESGDAECVTVVVKSQHGLTVVVAEMMRSAG